MTAHVPSPGCPDDAELAALSDGRLPADQRARIVAHVASCERCLDLVGALVRLDRVDAPFLPSALRERVARPGERSRGTDMGWRAGLAVAATVLLSLGGWFYTQRPAATPSPIESADQVRSRGVSAPAPNVLRPSSGQRVAHGPLEVQWQPTASAIGYRVRVMRDDGTLVWEGESPLTVLQVPRSAGLPVHAPLYVSVTALMPDGKTARSPSVRFELVSE